MESKIRVAEFNKEKIIIFILLAIVILLIISFFYIIFIPLKRPIVINSLFYSLGKLAGLVGFLFLSILIFSGETARFVDRFFGINKIILFQRKFALITFLLVILHPIFFMISSSSILPYMIPDFSVIPLSLGIISLYFLIIVMIASVLYKRISYKIWQYLHILTYLLFFFSLYHAVKTGSDYNYLSIKITYPVLTILIIIGIVYRTRYKIKQRASEKFFVKEIKKETDDTFTLVLETKNKFLFKPGQFCFLRLNKKGIYARHPFTISSSPDEKDLEFTIKLKGKFTKEALNLKKGEEVILDGPFGIFTLDNVNKNKDFVFIAGGVGITPFYSMIKSSVYSDIKRNITLFYCSKKANSIIFKKELDKIKEKWLKKVYIVSEDECSGDAKEKGIISKAIIAKYTSDINNSIFLICGPEKMKDCAIKELKGLGIKKENIIIEDFFW